MALSGAALKQLIGKEFGKGGSGCEQFVAGEEVDCFYRSHLQADNLAAADAEQPTEQPRSVGVTVGWFSATVLEDCISIDCLRFKPSTWVRVLIRHTWWFDRGGRFQDMSDVGGLEIRAHPSMLRRKPAGALEATCAYGFGCSAIAAVAGGASAKDEPHPWLSFLVLRWGGSSSFLIPHAQGTSAWGASGCTISDSTIERFFESTVLPLRGMRFRVLTAFVGGSEQLRALQAPALAAQLRRGAPTGCQIAALYFLWPVCIRESNGGNASMSGGGGSNRTGATAPTPSPPPLHPFVGEGYVPQNLLLGLMEQLEAQCVPTQFPHPSALYRVLLSKAWQAQLCGDATARLPPTTVVSRGMVAASPTAAAHTALGALRQLGAWRGEESDSAVKGVVKLGFSWQAVDVRAFVGEAQLRDALCALLHPARSPDTTHATALVQEWVEHDCEMRLFVVNGRVRHADFTRFEEPGTGVVRRSGGGGSGDDLGDDDGDGGKAACGTFSDAEFGMGREQALRKWFCGDEQALVHAEGEARALAARLQSFLLTQYAEQPPALRVDVRLKYHPACADSEVASPAAALAASKRVTVSTAEITELGFSMHGWPEGPEVVHEAMLQACCDTTQSESRAPEEEAIIAAAAKRLKS